MVRGKARLAVTSVVITWYNQMRLGQKCMFIATSSLATLQSVVESGAERAGAEPCRRRGREGQAGPPHSAAAACRRYPARWGQKTVTPHETSGELIKP
eukprot:4846978-Pleurochrysis_carterae.AAC.3